MKYCIYCGAENVDEAVFCTKCGKNMNDTVNAETIAEPQSDVQVPAMSQTEVQEKKKSKGKLAIICVIVIAILGAVIGIPAAQKRAEEERRQEIITEFKNNSKVDAAKSLFMTNLSSFSPKVYLDEENMEYVFEATVDEVSKSHLSYSGIKSAWDTVVDNNLYLAEATKKLIDSEDIDILFVINLNDYDRALVIRNGAVEFNVAN